MSRLRDELFSAKIENATLKLEIDALRRERTSLEAALGHVQAQDANSRKALEDVKQLLQEAKIKNAVYLERLDLLANHLPSAPTEAHNHVSEEAEDAEYALHTGLINRDEFDAILASAGALNTEVHFDSEPTRL